VTPRPHSTRRLLITLLIAAAGTVLLYDGIVLWHAWIRAGSGQTIIGLPHVDLLVYYACAREPADEGNWLWYASPYSSDPHSPAIYSHLTFSLLGMALRIARYSVFHVDQVFRLVFGTAALFMGAMVLVKALPARERQHPATVVTALLVIFGGGLAWLAGTWNLLTDWVFLRTFEQRNDALLDWLWYWLPSWELAEGGYGEWGASLVRTLFSVPECIYHVLFFGAMLAVLAGRNWLCVLLLFLTWWSHPFTGFMLGSILLLYFLTAGIRDQQLAKVGITALFVHALFLWYYFIYLPRFPEHRSVVQQMARFGTTMLVSKLLPAYGVLIVAAPVGLFRFRRTLSHDRSALLMACWLGVNLLLIFSDHFTTRAMQPLHFSRGYLYIPLAYFTARLLGSWTWANATASRQLACAVSLLLVHVPDTICYFLKMPVRLKQCTSEFAVSDFTARIFTELDQIAPPMTIHILNRGSLTAGDGLLPVLTHHRALLGHSFNTPFGDQKREYVRRITESLPSAAPPEHHLDALLMKQSELASSGSITLNTSSTVPLAEDLILLPLQKTKNATHQD
jgi:hypothetical protein